MRMFRRERISDFGVSLLGYRRALAVMVIAAAPSLNAQTPDQASVAQKMAQLTDAMARTQAQLERSQHDLDEMRRLMTELQRELAANGAAIPPASATVANAEGAPSSAGGDVSDSSSTASIADLRERVAMQESEITTQEQTKVESASKYPVKITGMLLMTGFKNTSAVDVPANPSVAIGGQGNAGSSIRQTILGVDARGPHLFGASSFADLRVDFFGSQGASGLTANAVNYNSNSSLLRLRTAHADLDWNRTQVYFALDHPILNPDAPTSLTASAIPALAWSGNLWTWNPQVGITQNLSRSGSTGIQLQAALMDAGDAPLTGVTGAFGVPPTTAEQSSKPGVEARVAVVGSAQDDRSMHIGLGGYFAAHDTAFGNNYNSWASTLDWKLPLPARLEVSGNFYRGAALGGLGAGGFKDFAYRLNFYTHGYYLRPLDDAGGWAQLKERATERLEFNAAYGMDNVFSGQLRPYYIEGGSPLQNLAINRTFSGNVIYSPSAYLLFSLEYRRIASTPVEDVSATSNVVGIAAGYRF